ncbi:MAG: hypothetical protein NC180_11070 [Muribaculaceae bacterium]|nr:hypothetical protein [Muribaculaceae bacterium]MCM1493754.1 hypothetical protein [Muribaculaceae bacterium]
MYIYELNVAMAKQELPLNDTLINAIKEAIEISNMSFSSTRYGRKLEYIDKIDDYHFHIKMKSKDNINASRSLSSLARALVKNEQNKNSMLLEKYIYNGSVFNTQLISSSKDACSHISDCQMLQELISMTFNQTTMNNRDKKLSREYTEKIREIVIEYINKKSLIN